VAGSAIVIAVAARPHPREQVSGDAWAIDWHEGACRLAVIDGLGHGPEAAAAAARACAALAAQPKLGPVEALAACHDALAGTRGAAISIAQIDPPAELLTYAGIGNVDAQLWQGGTSQRPIAYRGIVGVTYRTVRSFAVPLAPAWLLILHSDGVSARFDAFAVPDEAKTDPQTLADLVLERWGQQTDDATVLVARRGDGDGEH